MESEKEQMVYMLHFQMHIRLTANAEMKFAAFTVNRVCSKMTRSLAIVEKDY